MGDYEAGQFFFVNIPSLSLSEWHPFTASAVLDDSLVFYIKTMGAAPVVKPHPINPTVEGGSWTSRLAELARRAEQGVLLPAVRLYGPFGHNDFMQYENLVLFAGGIGITPMIAVFTDLRRRAQRGLGVGALRSVRLVWMSRSVAEFHMFAEIFAMVAQEQPGPRASCITLDEEDPDVMTAPLSQGHAVAGSPSTHAASCTCPRGASHHTHKMDSEIHTKTDLGQCRFNLQLHCTRRDSHASLTTPSSPDYVSMFIISGRCDVPGLLGAVPGTSTMAAVCGPLLLTASVSEQARVHGCDFHSEQFHF